MIAPQPYILHGKRSNHPVSLIVCWKQSAGDVSNRVIGHLDQELKLENCGEIKPAKYFSISGVEVKDDII